MTESLEPNKLADKTNLEIDEVNDEIESALKDPRGIISHQKRLAFCLSDGTVNLLEQYLKDKNVLKSGYKVDHRIFKKNKQNTKKILKTKITCSIDYLEKIDKILDFAYIIESKRNELVYGKKASEEFLNELISVYLDMKKEIDNE